MYARVTVTTDERKDALVVPTNAVVDYTGRRGVFVASGDSTVTFRPVRVGIEESEQIEILDGVAEGDRVVTTGAAALRDGDRVLLAGASGERRGDSEGAVSEGRGTREGALSERRSNTERCTADFRDRRHLRRSPVRQRGSGPRQWTPRVRRTTRTAACRDGTLTRQVDRPKLRPKTKDKTRTILVF